MCVDIAAVPSALDVAAALAKVKNRKAPDSSRIVPEMVKAGTDNFELCDLIAQLVGSVWKKEQVPQKWVDAILIPVPKKGNLRCCDNWRGIFFIGGGWQGGSQACSKLFADSC